IETNSTYDSLEASTKSFKSAYELSNGKYNAHDATTAQKGIIQLSSATNITSETLSATPKAVKAYNENDDKRLQKDHKGA
ncbi:phage tail protein, partial [Escherichia coli]|nr:phage tail protein [Escherichia coli]